MPWHVEQGGGTCTADEWAVIKDDDGSTAGCHDTEAEAEAQMAALYANESASRRPSMTLDRTAPREDLIRMGGPFVANRNALDGERVVVLRAMDDQDPAAGRLLFGYAAVFDEWTEIEGWEGHFRERISPGAFRKTLRDNGEAIQVLFNHGMDFSIGDKPLGRPRVQREDDDGLYVEVPLSRTSYNDDIIELLKDGALRGMSFRMSIMRDEWDYLNDDKRLPERTIKEVRLWEYGPVTFPAYEATTAGVRAHARDAYQRYLEARNAEQREVIEILVDGRSLRAQLLDGSLHSLSKPTTSEERGAIQSHGTNTIDTAWDGASVVTSADNDEKVLRYMHAWRDPDGDPTAKSTYKFPHHAAGTDTAANLKGVRSALSRLPQADIPDADRAGVERHLQRHLDDADTDTDSREPGGEPRDTLDEPTDPRERARMEESIAREQRLRREIEADRVSEIFAREMETADGRYSHL